MKIYFSPLPVRFNKIFAPKPAEQRFMSSCLAEISMNSNFQICSGVCMMHHHTIGLLERSGRNVYGGDY
ncbi:hypothetical protein D3Z36_00005 [Lachnospiraceae bacterium]|nr:hypothetical protein [Lachnospiraceae bacterium]